MMFLDLPAYGPDLKARYLAWRETQPRDMPEDFGLAEMVDQGDVVVLGVRVKEPPGTFGEIRLGFAWNDETRANPELCKEALRESVWRAIELIRLGRTEGLKSMGYIT